MSDTIEVINGDTIEVSIGFDTIDVIGGSDNIEVSNGDESIDVINGDIIEITQQSDSIEVVNDSDVIEITNNVIQLGGLSYENYTGADLDGQEGSENRTLTVTNTPVLIFLETGALQPIIDFTVDNLVITFSPRIFNQFRITIYSQ